MTHAPLEPAELAFDEKGTPVAPRYGDVYHSAAGGLAQAQHVFLAGNGLPARWQGRPSFAILELGFGLGLNFLATWQAWREDPARPQRLHYYAIEKHPPTAATLRVIHRHQAALQPLAERLSAAWPALIPGMRRLHFEDDGILLTLAFGDVRSLAERIEGRFDAFYLDGFAPDRNPEMWSPALCETLAWLAADGATLATWSVAGQVRRALAAAGFQVALQPGFGPKRAMTVARWPATAQRPAAQPGERRAAVLGAGIAGLTCAERLAARGWQVDLFERQPAPAAETSGNRQAVLLPVLALEPTRLARLNQAAFAYALTRYAALQAHAAAPIFTPCGVLQIARTPEHREKQQRVVAEQRLPPEFAQFLSVEAASALAGRPVAEGGWWFPAAGWLAPPALARALIAASGSALTLHLGQAISGLTATDAGWQLLDEHGRVCWQGATVILAHAHGLRRLPQSAHLPLRCFRGQTTLLPTAPVRRWPPLVVCREGYLAPPDAGFASLGATFQRSEDMAVTSADHGANLARLAQMLPDLAGRFDASSLGGRVGLRPVSPDKLPLVGALPQTSCAARPLAHVEWPRWPGLYVASGYGARGFAWAPLMAELLACQITGEPLPVEGDLIAAVDPARFPWKGIL